MKIRSYTSKDLPQVLLLLKKEVSYGGRFDETRDTEERFLNAANEGDMYVADEDGSVRGLFLILDNAHSFWLLRFAVDPDLQNAQAISSELMQKAYKVAKERGHSNVIVYTDPSNNVLTKRYQELGMNKGGIYQSCWKEVN